MSEVFFFNSLEGDPVNDAWFADELGQSEAGADPYDEAVMDIIAPDPAADARLLEADKSVPVMRAGDVQQVTDEVVGRYHPRQTEIGEGFVSRVTIVNRAVVVKVPHGDDPRLLGALAREHTVLQALEDIEIPGTAIPRLVEFSPDPAYLVATYVPGRTITQAELQAQPPEVRAQLGRDFGVCILKQAAAVDPRRFAEAGIPPLGVEDWPAFFDKYIGGFHHPDFPSLSLAAGALYAEWRQYTEGRAETKRHFIHGDLTLANAAVTPDYRLSGMYDLARAHLGDLDEELSTLVRLDDALFRGCVQELEAGGMPVDVDAVKLWRHMKDFQVLSYWVTHGNPGHRNFIAVRDTIAARWPGLDWAELYRTVP